MQTDKLSLTDPQKTVIKHLHEAVHSGDYRTGLPFEIGQQICKAFGDDYMLSVCGLGGTRYIIQHPFKDGFVFKIAFCEDGIQGNRDEYNDYHSSPDHIKEFLGEPGDLLEDGLILEMKHYEALTEEQELIDYSQQLGQILEKIEFIHYENPPYHHSFGLDQDGKLILIDYGEIEKFNIKSQIESEEITHE